jgi:uncharacterized Zn-finger protein
VTAERSDKLIQPNAQHQYEVTVADLPLACPMPGMHLWNSHPRVFLAVEKLDELMAAGAPRTPV